MDRRSSLLMTLIALLAGGALVPHLTSGTPSSQSAGSAVAQTASAAAAPGVGPGDADHFIDLVGDLLNVSVTDRTRAFQVLTQAAPQYFDRVQFLIASLPDPVDSFAGWQFDPTMAAIEEAVAASGFVLDRFWFPTTDATVAAASASAAHEHQPGVVLFRSDQPRNQETDDRARKLLVVFVVPETPTAGVHLPAFNAALDTIAQWSRTDAAPDEPVLVLGPYFSGGSHSIARALVNVRRKADVRIISGSATKDDNTQVFGELGIDFSATVPPDSLMEAAILDYLQTHVDRAIGLDGHRYAILRESNTVYGSQAGIRDTKTDRQPVIIPFPLHISRVRDETQQPAAATTTLGLAPRFRPLTLGDSGHPTDQLPAFAPQTTASYVELALANLLETIRREQVGAVGIMATDTRDKLFLARQIARTYPNVILFTTDNDLLFEHPDYYDSTAGMLVASAYPLYPQNQAWTDGTRNERRQFPTSSAEGVFNATLALLNYSRDGHFINTDVGADPRARMVEYGRPGSLCVKACWSPVWLSVVGHDLPWPLMPWPARVDGAASTAYQFKADRGMPESSGMRVAVPLYAKVMFSLLGLLVCVHIAFAVRIRRRTRLTERWAFVGMSSLALFIGWWFVCRVALAWAGMTPGVTLVIASVVAIALGAGLAALTIASLAFGVRYCRRCPAWIASGIVLLISAYSLHRFLGEQAATMPMFIERTAYITNGVSPAVPVLGLLAAVYVWAAMEVYRLTHPGAPSHDESAYVKALLSDEEHTVDYRLAPLDRSLVAVPKRWALVIALLAAATCVFVLNPLTRPLRSIDGLSFGRAATWLLMLVHILIAAALVQFIGSWLAIGSLLNRLAALPTADAYKRIPAKLFPQDVFPRLPRLSDLEEAVKRWKQLWNDGLPPDLARQFNADLRLRPDALWSSTSTWHDVLTQAREALNELRQGASQPRADQLEEFAVLPIVFMGRSVLARMWDNVLFTTGAILLLLTANVAYPFQWRHGIDAVLWVDIAVTVGAVLFVVVRMEHDELLSNIRSTTPGRIEWNRDFMAKLAVYGLVPLVGLFATQFPNIGQTIAQWIQPVQKALP